MEVKLNNYIVFDRVAFKELPNRVSTNMEMFGVAVDTRNTLDGSAVRVIRPVVNDNIYETTPRLSKYNIVELNWDAESFATVCMVDHLTTLHEACKPFMFTFDNEYSYTNEQTTRLSSTEYLLPTYPIAHTKTVIDNITQYNYAINVKINGVDASNTNAYYINNTTGSIIFANPIDKTDVVTVDYKWAIWCKINNVTHKNVGDIARTAYQVSVILEQLEFPDYIDETYYKYVVDDCRECTTSQITESGNDPGDDDPGDETSTEICNIPTIFNNNGVNTPNNSSNRWGNYTGASPFSATISNHKVSDTNTVGTEYPLHIYDKTSTFKIASDKLSLSGVTFTDLPSDRKVSKVYVELDLITQDTLNSYINVIDTMATITINSTSYSLAKFEAINGSKTVRYELTPETKLLTDSVVDNAVLFDYQIHSELPYTLRDIPGYDASDWSITTSSTVQTSPSTTAPYTSSFTITGTYIGNLANIPEQVDYLIEQEIKHNFNASLGAYDSGEATIDCGLGNIKDLGLSNQGTDTVTFRRQNIFTLDVVNNQFTITLPLSVTARTVYSGSVIAYKTRFEIINHGIVKPENSTFDTTKLFDVNPITSVAQWTKTSTIRYFYDLRYYTGTSYDTYQNYSPSSGFAPVPTTDRLYDERRIGDIEYSYTYTGAGTPPPYLIIKADLDFRYVIGQNVVKNTADSLNVNDEEITITDKLGIEQVDTYGSFMNYDSSAMVDMRTLAQKTGYKIVKIPVVNGKAKFYVYDTYIRGELPSVFGTVTSATGGVTPHMTINHYNSTASIPAHTERTVRIDQARVGVCWIEPTSNGDKGVINEVQTYELTPSSETTTSSSASTAVIEKTYTFNTSKFDVIPDNSYTVGTEVSSFVTSYSSPVNSTLNSAVAKAKLSYVASSTGFVEYAKSSQNVDLTTHHNTGVIDTTNDKTYGGLYDYFGKTQSDLNKANILSNSGLVIYAKYNQTTPVGLVFTAGHYTLGSTVTATGSFATGSSLVSGNTNGYGGTPGATLSWTGSSTSGRGSVSSNTLIEVTNTNAGTLSPKYVYLTVNSTCYYSYTCTSHKSVVYDGFVYTTSNATNPNTIVNSVKVKVPMGPDKKGYYLLRQGTYFDLVGATAVTASTGVSASIATQQESPDITDVKLKLYAVLPSSSDSVVFTSSTWATTPYKGTNGSIFRSSDGTLTGAYTLQLSSPYNLTLPSTSTDIVTGIEITCDAKSVNGQPITDTLNFKYIYGPTNIASSNVSNVITGLTGEPIKLRIGGSTNLFSATPTIADILDTFKIEVSGTNASGKILQLSNIRVKIYYVKVQ